jgi:hypothetical protein
MVGYKILAERHLIYKTDIVHIEIRQYDDGHYEVIERDYLKEYFGDYAKARELFNHKIKVFLDQGYENL